MCLYESRVRISVTPSERSDRLQNSLETQRAGRLLLQRFSCSRDARFDDRDARPSAVSASSRRGPASRRTDLAIPRFGTRCWTVCASGGHLKRRRRQVEKASTYLRGVVETATKTGSARRTLDSDADICLNVTTEVRSVPRRNRAVPRPPDETETRRDRDSRISNALVCILFFLDSGTANLKTLRLRNHPLA